MATIGCTLLVPSIVGMLFSIFVCYKVFTSTAEGLSPDQEARAGAGAAMALVIAVPIFFFCSVGGLIGSLLVTRKTVLHCDHCGTFMADPDVIED